MNNDLITTADAAKILGVSKKTVENWRTRKLFGCTFFPADEKHGDTWYYYRDRVEQLKAVYHKGILQNMYKLARKFAEKEFSNNFQKPSSSKGHLDSVEKIFYDAEEVADILKVDEKTLDRWRKSGKLKEYMIDHTGLYWYSADVVNQFLSSYRNSDGNHADLEQYQARFKPSITADDINEIANLTKDELQKLKHDIKFANHELIFQKAPADGYICPKCGSGTGKNGTGLKVTELTDGFNFTCFAHNCFEHYGKDGELKAGADFLGLVAELNGLDTRKRKDFRRTLAIAKKIVEHSYNQKFSDINFDETKRRLKQSEYTQAQLDTIADEVKLSQINADKIAELSDEDKRGLTIETFKHHRAGLLFNWRHVKNPKTLPSTVLTLPSHRQNYAAIHLLSDRKKNPEMPKVMYVGERTTCNLDPDNCKTTNRILIVEGEIDGLSISQAMNYSETVIITGGTGAAVKVIRELIDILNKQFDADERLNFLPIILMDSDSAGKDCADKLQKLFFGEGYPAYSAFLVDDPNFKIDANDILIGGGNKTQIKAILEEKFSVGTFGGQAVLKSLLDDIIKNAQAELPNNLDAIKNLQSNKNENAPVTPPQNNSSALTTKGAIPNCPVELDIPSGYGMNEYCILSNLVPFCYTPVVITGILRESDTKNTFTRIAFYDKLTKCWHDEIFADGVLADKRKILALTDKGINFTDRTAKELCAFLNALKSSEVNAIRIPRIEIFRQTGWHEYGGNEIFVYENDADGRYILRRTGWQYADIFKHKGSRAVQLETLKSVAEKNTAARLLIGASVLAPLIHIATLPNVQVHIHGRRNIGKSPLLKFCASLFGNPREYVKTFDSSIKELTETSAGFKDLPIFIDELESFNERDPLKALSKIIYDFFNGKTRQVLKRDGTPREVYRFQGCRITNGEQNIIKPHMKSGAMKRVLSIECERLFDEKFSLALHRTVERNYGFLGAEWIEKLKSADEKFVEDFQSEYDAKYNEVANGAGKYHEKTHIQMTVASLLAFYKFAEFVGVADELYYDIDNDIHAVIRKLPTSEEIDDTNRAIDFLRDFILSHHKNFDKSVRNKTVENEGEYPGSYMKMPTPFDCYGFIGTDDSVAFYPSSLRTILEDEGGFSSADKLFSEWRHEGKITCNSGDRFTHYMTLPTGNKQRMVDFKPGVLIETEKNYKRRQDKVEDDESDDYADDGYNILDDRNFDDD